MEQFARHENQGVRYFVASVPDAPSHLLEQLAWDDYTDIREAVAMHPNTPGKILEQLLKDEHRISQAVVKNPSLPESFLEQLLLSNDVKGYLHQNPNGLPIILEHYAKSKLFLDRLIVLLHSQMSSRVLTEKSRSSAWLERYAVAQNPSTPTQIRQELAQDGNRVVRAAAKAYQQQHS